MCVEASVGQSVVAKSLCAERTAAIRRGLRSGQNFVRARAGQGDESQNVPTCGHGKEIDRPAGFSCDPYNHTRIQEVSKLMTRQQLADQVLFILDDYEVRRDCVLLFDNQNC